MKHRPKGGSRVVSSSMPVAIPPGPPMPPPGAMPAAGNASSAVQPQMPTRMPGVGNLGDTNEVG